LASRVGVTVPKRFFFGANHPYLCRRGATWYPIPCSGRRGWVPRLISVSTSVACLKVDRQQAASSCASNGPTRGLETSTCASTMKVNLSRSTHSAQGKGGQEGQPLCALVSLGIGSTEQGYARQAEGAEGAEGASRLEQGLERSLHPVCLYRDDGPQDDLAVAQFHPKIGTVWRKTSCTILGGCRLA
jgi:hypothetical protein